MKKWIYRTVFCTILVILIWLGGLVADRDVLDEEIMRIHITANSNTDKDQSYKYAVRDAIVEHFGEDLQNISDINEAKAYVQDNIPRIEEIANQTLKMLGCSDRVSIFQCREEFTARVSENVRLPAGYYNALRIIIGNGEGRNWWGVMFPASSLGMPPREAEEIQVGAGFSASLQDAIERTQEYEIRFLLLDFIGKLESKLRMG